MSDYNTENHEAILALIEGHEFVTEVGMNGYAEPGYTDPESGIIVLGNWNDDEPGFGGQDEDGEDQTLSEESNLTFLPCSVPPCGSIPIMLTL